VARRKLSGLGALRDPEHALLARLLGMAVAVPSCCRC